MNQPSRTTVFRQLRAFWPVWLVFALLFFFPFGCGQKKEKDDFDKLAEQVDQRRAAQDANLQAAAKLGPDVLGYLTVQQVLVAHKVPLNKIFLFDQYFIPTNDKFV